MHFQKVENIDRSNLSLIASITLLKMMGHLPLMISSTIRFLKLFLICGYTALQFLSVL